MAPLSRLTIVAVAYGAVERLLDVPIVSSKTLSIPISSARGGSIEAEAPIVEFKSNLCVWLTEYPPPARLRCPLAALFWIGCRRVEGCLCGARARLTWRSRRRLTVFKTGVQARSAGTIVAAWVWPVVSAATGTFAALHRGINHTCQLLPGALTSKGPTDAVGRWVWLAKPARRPTRKSRKTEQACRTLVDPNRSFYIRRGPPTANGVPPVHAASRS